MGYLRSVLSQKDAIWSVPAPVFEQMSGREPVTAVRELVSEGALVEFASLDFPQGARSVDFGGPQVFFQVANHCLARAKVARPGHVDAQRSMVTVSVAKVLELSGAEESASLETSAARYQDMDLAILAELGTP